VKSLGVADGRLLLVTTAAALFAHVSHNVEAEIISFDDHARNPEYEALSPAWLLDCGGGVMVAIV